MVVPGSEFHVDPLPCMVPVRPHPDALEVEQESNAWARHHLPQLYGGDADSFLARRSPSWLGSCFPTASREQLMHAWNFNHLAFWLDDACIDWESKGHRAAEGPTQIAKQIRGLAEPATIQDRFFLETLSVCTETMEPGVAGRVREGVAIIFDGFAEQIEYMVDSQHGPTLDLHGCIDMRTRSVGLQWFETWTEHIAGVDLTVEHEQHPILRKVTRLAGLQTLYVNEICSFRIEHFGGEHANLLCFAMNSGAQLQEAVNLVLSLAAQAERDFHQLSATILNTPWGSTAEVKSYLQALAQLIAGATEWQYNVVRYHGVGFECDPGKGGTWKLLADRTVLLDP
ncbi:terpene synthase family protein [Nocardia sp. NPDC006044]|uniref:terpene synthase family protein n=1 Tax=Nocardia sp. NPDC006044 TaxID=3364306 RepID=UPI0036C49CC0